MLTHWGWVMHICISNLTIISSDNGLLPGRHQAIIWTNAGILVIRIVVTNFSEILSEIHTFSFKKMNLKMSSAKWWPVCHGPNVLSSMKRQWNMPWSYPLYKSLCHLSATFGKIIMHCILHLLPSQLPDNKQKQSYLSIRYDNDFLCFYRGFTNIWLMPAKSAPLLRCDWYYIV